MDAKSERWVKVAQEDAVSENAPLGVAAEGVDIALWKTAGAVNAFEGRCPHAGTLLSEGELRNGELVCRAHQWRFDCATGARKDEPGVGLERVPCHVREGQVFVELSAKAETKRAASRFADLPGPKPWPIVGNLLQIDTRVLHTQLAAWAEQYGPVYRLSIAGQAVVVVSDPVLCDEVLRARPNSFARMRSMTRIVNEAGMDGLFSAEGDAWRAQRRLAMEALSPRHFASFYPFLVHAAERVHARWSRAAKTQEVVQIADDFTFFTAEVTTRLAFGIDLDFEGEHAAVREHLHTLFPALSRRIYTPLPYWRVFKLPQDRRLDRSIAALSDICDVMITRANARLEALPEAERKPRHFLDAMLLARDEDGRPFTRKTIFGNVLTMMLAGEDTTAHSLAYAVHELCEHASASAALKAESDAVLAEAIAAPTLETLARLPYADAVAQETLRMHPVAPFLAFDALHDVVLGDIALKAGTVVYTLVNHMARRPESFEDANAFMPERWLGARASSAFIPFGSGPRLCPGRSLAQIEMRMVLSMLSHGFEVERVGKKEDVGDVFEFTAKPERLQVRLRARRAAK